MSERDTHAEVVKARNAAEEAEARLLGYAQLGGDGVVLSDNAEELEKRRVVAEVTREALRMAIEEHMWAEGQRAEQRHQAAEQRHREEMGQREKDAAERAARSERENAERSLEANRIQHTIRALTIAIAAAAVVQGLAAVAAVVVAALK